MNHRGPDDEGYYINPDGNIGFGHRRLSIIDLSSCGHQPMSNEDNTIWITYNGEIYNYLELKEYLLKKGHLFKSKTDTEVIIHLYEEMGSKCVEKLNGMFAFAIWDDKRKELFLARDHLGIKPLYYTFLDGTLLFGSEIKSILQNSKVERQVNLEAVSEYFTFQNILGDKTFFDGIKMLLPGHIMICKNKNVNIREYWDVSFIESSVEGKHEEEACIERFLEIFKDSVKRQMLTSDVPVATYLSGGIDSGSITTIASKVIKGRVKSFTCGFEPETGFDERRYAKIVADNVGSEHYEFVPKIEDFVEIFPDLIWHLDEPRMGSSYPPYFVSQLASKYVKVILAGEGGDELFAGYPRHLIGFNSDAPGNDSFDRRCYESFIYLFFDNVRKQLFSDEMFQAINFDAPYENFRYYLGKTNASIFCNKVLYMDLKFYLHGLLVVEDKISMAHSIETRLPFLDTRLVEFATQIPFLLRTKNGTLKYIPRMAMKRFLPSIITDRPKMGFGCADAIWWREGMRDLIYELLLGDRAKARGYFNYDFVKRIIDMHMNYERNYSIRIWSLLCFELWHRIFIDGKSL
jgi:asparagine synthase (glutamine-hydrolysing)